MEINIEQVILKTRENSDSNNRIKTGGKQIERNKINSCRSSVSKYVARCVDDFSWRINECCGRMAEVQKESERTNQPEESGGKTMVKKSEGRLKKKTKRSRCFDSDSEV